MCVVCYPWTLEFSFQLGKIWAQGQPCSSQYVLTSPSSFFLVVEGPLLLDPTLLVVLGFLNQARLEGANNWKVLVVCVASAGLRHAPHPCHCCMI